MMLYLCCMMLYLWLHLLYHAQGYRGRIAKRINIVIFFQLSAAQCGFGCACSWRNGWCMTMTCPICISSNITLCCGRRFSPQLYRKVHCSDTNNACNTPTPKMQQTTKYCLTSCKHDKWKIFLSRYQNRAAPKDIFQQAPLCFPKREMFC